MNEPCKHRGEIVETAYCAHPGCNRMLGQWTVRPRAAAAAAKRAERKRERQNRRKGRGR